MISSVVLAAGRSTRMGEPKQVMRIRGKPLLRIVLETLRKAKVDETVVVLGPDAGRIMEEVGIKGERVVVNPRQSEGMSSSLRLGLRSLSPDTTAAVVVLGDMPLLSPSTVNRIIDGYLSKGAPVVVPTYRGVRGNPVLFARSVFPEIMKIRGDVGARSVVDSQGGAVLEVPVADEGVMVDIDTQSDYGRVAARSRRARRRRSQGGG